MSIRQFYSTYLHRSPSIKYMYLSIDFHSTYLVQKRLDMLPKLLTETLCSLTDKDDHFAFRYVGRKRCFRACVQWCAHAGETEFTHTRNDVQTTHYTSTPLSQ